MQNGLQVTSPIKMPLKRLGGICDLSRGNPANCRSHALYVTSIGCFAGGGCGNGVHIFQQSIQPRPHFSDRLQPVVVIAAYGPFCVFAPVATSYVRSALKGLLDLANPIDITEPKELNPPPPASQNVQHP
ncbi:hypothetical protein EMIT051CA3_90051 [Pseudomonas chlororaphis]